MAQEQGMLLMSLTRGRKNKVGGWWMETADGISLPRPCHLYFGRGRRSCVWPYRQDKRERTRGRSPSGGQEGSSAGGQVREGFLEEVGLGACPLEDGQDSGDQGREEGR